MAILRTPSPARLARIWDPYVTFKAGGSFVKLDAGGVTLSGGSIKMNSGGSPGSGSGWGGQMPIHMRLPKLKGFKNPFRVEYNFVNLDALDDFASGTVVDPETLRERGLVAKRGLVKVLGRGEISNSLTVKAHRFSDSAKAAIEAAGGTTELIALPWGDRRPPAKGNALTNR